MPSGDTWTDLRVQPEPPPRRRWWRRLGMPLLITLVAGNAAYAESRQRVRDAVTLRKDNESIALSWLAWQAAERAGNR